MKLTPIFPPHIKPVRKGVYKTGACDECGKLLYWSYWNGKEWGWFESSKVAARPFKRCYASVQNKRWQGVEKP